MPREPSALREIRPAQMPRVEVADRDRIADLLRGGRGAAEIDQRRDLRGVGHALHLADEYGMRLGLAFLRQLAIEGRGRVLQHRGAGRAARPLPEGEAVVAIVA